MEQSTKSTLTLEEASERLNVSHKIVRRLIDEGRIPATQVVPFAPWEISSDAIESADLLQEIKRIKRRVNPHKCVSDESLPMFTGI
jgi:predicted site-specific integrase-resolvase